MADDRGTDYVIRRGLEAAKRQEPITRHVIDLVSQVNTDLLPGCGFEAEILRHLNMKLLDVLTHLQLRQQQLQKRVEHG